MNEPSPPTPRPVPDLSPSVEGDTSAADGGAEAPRKVIRGESPEIPGTPSAAIPVRVLTDWLNFTFPFDGQSASIERFVQLFGDATDGTLGGLNPRGRGLHGYTESFAFDQGGATFAFGGQRQTALVSLPGDACHLVPDWQRLANLGEKQLLGRVTRWDGAADDFEGKHSVDLARELFLAGAFNQGGRSPLPRVAGNWVTPDTKGRTFYVGQRANGKLARIYEKGKQLGYPDSPWVRWEVELHNVDRVVPWAVLLAPDHFLSGAYPCMGWIGDLRSRIRTVRDQDDIVYSRMREIASIAYGALINVMLEREGSPERVIELLRKNGTPRRLTFSDAFLKHHAWHDDV